MQPKKIVHTKQSGFVALLSTIIIGAVLLTLTIEVGQRGFYTRFIVLGHEAKEQSRVIAEGCGNQALAMILHDLSSIGDVTTESGVGVCYIYPIEKKYPTAEFVTIRVQGIVRGSVTNLILTYRMGNIYQGVIPLSPYSSPDEITTPELVTSVEVDLMP